MLKANFEVCAGAVHGTCPRNPTSSLTDGSLGLYQPHTANKAKASPSRASQETPRIPGTHSSDRKALEAPFN